MRQVGITLFHIRTGAVLNCYTMSRCCYIVKQKQQCAVPVLSQKFASFTQLKPRRLNALIAIRHVKIAKQMPDSFGEKKRRYLTNSSFFELRKLPA